MSLRILILRFSSMGDIVLTTPVIRCLKAKYRDDVSIHFMCKAPFKPLLEANPYLDKIWTFQSEIDEIIPELKLENFTHIVDLQRNFKSGSLIRSLGIPATRLHKLNIKKWILVNFGIDLLPDVHIVDRYMDAVRHLDVVLDSKGLDYFIPKSISDNDDFAESIPDKIILFALGGAHLGKRMTAKQWSEIATKLDFPIVLIGGKDDVPEADVIQSSVGNQVINLCGKLSIHQSAILASRAEVVLTGDTGMMHIASAFEAKIISVWGCTVPKFGMYPFRSHPKSSMLEPLQLKRRPCSKLGNRCKYGMSNRCITHLSTDAISREVLRLKDE